MKTWRVCLVLALCLVARLGAQQADPASLARQLAEAEARLASAPGSALVLDVAEVRSLAEMAIASGIPDFATRGRSLAALVEQISAAAEGRENLASLQRAILAEEEADRLRSERLEIGANLAVSFGFLGVASFVLSGATWILADVFYEAYLRSADPAEAAAHFVEWQKLDVLRLALLGTGVLSVGIALPLSLPAAIVGSSIP